jgi:hypothetical protein
LNSFEKRLTIKSKSRCLKLNESFLSLNKDAGEVKVLTFKSDELFKNKIKSKAEGEFIPGAQLSITPCRRVCIDV